MLLSVTVLICLYAVKTIRNIFSNLMVLMFFIPETGFFYIRHSCLRSEDEYTPPGWVALSHIELILIAAFYSNDLFPNIHESIAENAHSLPFALSSVDMLRRYSVLLI